MLALAEAGKACGAQTKLSKTAVDRLTPNRLVIADKVKKLEQARSNAVRQLRRKNAKEEKMRNGAHGAKPRSLMADMPGACATWLQRGPPR